MQSDILIADDQNAESKAIKALIDKKSVIGEILSQKDLFGTFGLKEFLDTEDIKYFNDLDIYKKDGNIYINCVIKKIAKIVKSDKVSKPEEIIRQLYLIKLNKYYKYPLSHIDIERPVTFGREVRKRDDIVVYRNNERKEEYILVEVKKPNVKEGLDQLKAYGNATGAPLLVLTDGKTTTILERTDPNLFEALTDLPKYGQTTDDIRKDKLTFSELQPAHDLKQLVQDIENAVLANAGVNTFDEIFKLIYAKLYDEIVTPRNEDRIFKVTSASTQQHLEKIKTLFEKARERWGEGVFDDFENLRIPANAIVPAISILQKHRLYNGNFMVIDEAFEYLINSDSKGEKGQYFTPRFVIDMCVEMLQPSKDEYLIDTAAGSCGFPVHAMQHIWNNKITEEKYGENYLQAQKEYAQEYLYAIDFDQRAVKVAKAIMLIAGDGKTHVVNANTLDPSVWNNEVKAILNNRLQKIENIEQNEENKRQFSKFDFDVLMTNPPFAGDINGSLLSKYELAYNKNKIRSKMSRDVLFIERNLNFLKPGGRMAIVLPQGVFNNTNMQRVREFLFDKARILAVVGLHTNTFRPHAGVKTSVLFLQKWGGIAGKPLNNYPIFMAVSQKGGKDNSGDYIYKKKEDDSYEIDSLQNRIYDTDLTEISEGFVKWGKEQKFSFIE